MLLFRRETLPRDVQVQYEGFPTDFNDTKWGREVLPILRTQKEIARYLTKIHPELFIFKEGKYEYKANYLGQPFNLTDLYWNTSGIPRAIYEYVTKWLAISRAPLPTGSTIKSLAVPAEETPHRAVLDAIVNNYTKLKEYVLGGQQLWDPPALPEYELQAVS